MANDRPRTPANGPRAQLTPDPALVSRPARGPIVVVDGDRVECSRTCRVLGDVGFEMISAGDGPSALRRVFATSESPSLLLCAIELPGMSGIELAARMSAARPGIRVILTSPDAATVERARQHAPLVRAVLLKPYTTDALRAAAVEALGPEA